MYKKRTLIGLVLLAIIVLYAWHILRVHGVHSQVQESESLHIVVPLSQKYQQQGKEVLVVFDLDNTLVRGASLINSLEFFKARQSKLISQGVSKEDAWHTACIESSYIVHYQPMQLVDVGSISVLQALRDHGIKWIGLTAKPLHFVERTFDQIDGLGITWNFPVNNNLYLYLDPAIDDPALYTRGILFCGRYNPKEDALMEFFRKTFYKPQVVIFVDDEPQNMKGLQRKMKGAGIAFEGIRYSACDQYAQLFNYEKAEKEYKAFRKWMKNYQFQPWEFLEDGA